MFRKLSNKILLITFIVLALIVVAVFVTDHQKGDRTFKSELFKVDSSAVTAITIYPKGNGKDILKLTKSGKKWEILSQNQRFPADSSTIKSILHTLAHITPEGVAGTDKSNWKDFQISDSASVHVIVEQGTNTTADFRVGKVSFSRGPQQESGGNQNMQIKSHIRVAGDDRVYVVDGFLSMLFSTNPDQYKKREPAKPAK